MAGDAANIDKGFRLRILISNVKQSNRSYDLLIETVLRERPDIAVFTEVDEKWKNALRRLLPVFAHSLERPLDNSYGMLLLSRLPLSESSVRFLISAEVPSFDTLVSIGDHAVFRLITVHPEPPVLTSDSTLRDAEISKVAILVRDEDYPVIVTGDLNDVAWSRLTRQFLRVSRLLDPREGRGFYSTFHANYFVVRWPLDHLFHSRHFSIVDIKRLSNIGSDHFPIMFELSFDASQKHGRVMRRPGQSEIAETLQKIEEGEQSGRRPIGHNWEN